MGLDMYLRKKTYVGANYEHRKISGTLSIKKAGKPYKIKLKRVSEISESVGYWRKANAIHKWFVDNCQKGVDDCGEYYVSVENLKELLSVCEEVEKANKRSVKKTAKKLLPTQEGFFFGGTEINDWYFEDVKYTIKLIKSLFKENKEDADFYYQSSW